MSAPSKCPNCASPLTVDSRVCESCGRPLVPSSAVPTLEHSPAWAEPSETRFLPGVVLAGRYRIIGLLGRGGMGEVYRADDLKLGQPVALKFLPSGLDSSSERVRRFLGEVRTARQVSHANVCRIYDAAEANGYHFLSMEYIDGEDLASLLRRIGHLPKDKAIQIARQLCAGLAASHEIGLLHRDLKPANVMIDGRGRARITDFGLARFVEEVEGAEILSGTPAYMAPEQLAGREATVRSDIYSLGLVLYELLRRTVPALVVAGLLGSILFYPETGSIPGYIVGSVFSFALFWGVLFRSGLLGFAATFQVYRLLDQLPLTLHLDDWYLGIVLLALAFIATPALWGFWTSRAGRPLFGDEIFSPASQP